MRRIAVLIVGIAGILVAASVSVAVLNGGQIAAKDDQTIEIGVVGKVTSERRCEVRLRTAGTLAFPIPHQFTIENADGTVVGMRNLKDVDASEVTGDEDSVCFVYTSITVTDSPFYTVRVDGDYLATVNRSDLPLERPFTNPEDDFTLMPVVRFED